MSIKANSTRQHVLTRPDMYVGSIETKKKSVYIFENGKIVPKKIRYNEGLERIFIEIVANAIDNKWESEQSKIKMSKIDFEIVDDRITITNDGKWIPIIKSVKKIENEYDATKFKKVEDYEPRFCFTYPRAGRNFNDEEERKTAGRNGLGSKLSNFLSKEFRVMCIDPENKKKFEMICRNNMSVIEEPIITKISSKTGLTQISFVPDYKRFNFETLSTDFVALFKRHAYECALNTGLNLTFNSEKLSVKNLSQYASLYFDEKPNMIAISHEETDVLLVEQSRNVATKQGFHQVSFVNGINTDIGGTHVDAWIKKLLTPIQKELNGTSTKNTAKTKKVKEKKVKVALKQLQRYFFIFVRTEIDKPKFESQGKHQLVSPLEKEISTTKLNDVQFKKIMKWDFVQHIREEIEIEEQRQIPKNKKTGFIKHGSNLDNANWATQKHSIEKRQQCILFVTEGLSAKTIVTLGKEVIEEGHNRVGAMAIRGKLLNVTGDKAKIKLFDNKEIRLLEQVMNLQRGVDYSKQENRDTLNYGTVCWLTDADDDGFHIRGLCLNFLYTYYPGLFEHSKKMKSMVKNLNSPAIRVSCKGGKILTFYSHYSFLRWQETADQSTVANISYYKGLGTNSDDFAKEIFEKMKVVVYNIGEEDDKYMKIGLETKAKSKMSDKRKELISNFGSFTLNDKNEIVEDRKEMIEGTYTLTDFVKNELVLFHIEDVNRSIPNLMDGLKESQRKILYAVLKAKLTKAARVDEVSGDVKKYTKYHHGGAALEGTIIKMSQGFVGARNIPYLFATSQNGSRLYMGKDAPQARYAEVMFEPLMKFIFRDEDIPLLISRVDEGVVIEPEQYYPVIPMCLINGSKAIAVGWSSDTPNYNPEDCVGYIRKWLKRKESSKNISLPILKPWWRGFKGEIIINEKKGIETVITKGILEKHGKEYHITELPIKLATEEFKDKILEDVLMKGKHITSIGEFNTKNEVHFTIKPAKDFLPDIDTNLKSLIKSQKISNMVMLVKGVPKLFKTVYDIMEEYCEERYDMYARRKEYLLKKLCCEKLREENKIRFMDEVMSGKLKMYNRDKNEILEDMKKSKYDADPMAPYMKDDRFKPYAYLTEIPFGNINKQRLEKLRNSIENIQNKINSLERKTQGDLWREDLVEFEKEYAKFLKRTEKKLKSKITKTKKSK